MSTTVTTTAEPTLGHYQCGSGCSPLSFKWTRPMPQNGWLGEVTFGQYVNKPIQVYGAEPILYNGHQVGLNWGFQAQDGSFVCRMYVSSNQNNINFVNCRPFANWSLTSCFAIY